MKYQRRWKPRKLVQVISTTTNYLAKVDKTLSCIKPIWWYVNQVSEIDWIRRLEFASQVWCTSKWKMFLFETLHVLWLIFLTQEIQVWATSQIVPLTIFHDYCTVFSVVSIARFTFSPFIENQGSLGIIPYKLALLCLVSGTNPTRAQICAKKYSLRMKLCFSENWMVTEM
jgi:hypothetical protein